MRNDKEAVEAVEDLLAWAEAEGVTMNGIRAIPLTGRGIGIVSTRKITKGESILDVPTSCLHSLDTTRAISKKLPKHASTQCILTLDILLDKSPSFAKWKAVMPSLLDMSAGMPILWPPELQERLPLSAKKLLEKQKAKVDRDWAVATSASAFEVEYEDFLHSWLLVNSRTFYHVTERTEKLPTDDRMVLQPVADLFNHTAVGGCKVSFDDEGFTVVAERDMDKGEEVLISYGRHSNDFLLVEYGFFLDDNEWDEFSLDDGIIKRLRPRQKEMLEEKGYLGGYFVDRRQVCHRTEVVARMLCLSTREWFRFLEDGIDDDPSPRVKKEIRRFLEEALDGAEKMVQEIDGIEVGTRVQIEVLKGRWLQIRDFLDAKILEDTADE
jgi:hypothetical protein